jgi:hypothetical protein
MATAPLRRRLHADVHWTVDAALLDRHGRAVLGLAADESLPTEEMVCWRPRRAPVALLVTFDPTGRPRPGLVRRPPPAAALVRARLLALDADLLLVAQGGGRGWLLRVDSRADAPVPLPDETTALRVQVRAPRGARTVGTLSYRLGADWPREGVAMRHWEDAMGGGWSALRGPGLLPGTPLPRSPLGPVWLRRCLNALTETSITGRLSAL